MDNKPENPPAFPFAENGNPFGNYHGMTLRDYFAAKAMQGMLANAYYNNTSIKDIADDAFTQADAMLKARSALSDDDIEAIFSPLVEVE